MEPVATRMWDNGPLRMFSSEGFVGSISYSSPRMEGFVGRYVCDMCRNSSNGVYVASYHLKVANPGISGWVCGSCKDGNVPVSRPERKLTAEHIASLQSGRRKASA